MANALVLLADGFEDVEAVTVVDVLRRGGVTAVTASVGANRVVTSAHGIRMEADAPLSEAAGAEFDALILPGGGKGTEALAASSAVLNRLRRQKDEGRLICAICAAPTVLVKAGVLDPGQQVTCYPTCADGLDRPCAGVPVVRDGNVITGEAPGASMLFALVVLEAIRGEDVARQVRDGLVTDVL